MSSETEPKTLPPYDGAKKYVIPIQENTDGEKRIMFGTLGNVLIHPAEQCLLIYAPGMPYATVYTYLDIKDIVGWIQAEQALVKGNKPVRFDAALLSDEDDGESLEETSDKISEVLNGKWGNARNKLSKLIEEQFADEEPVIYHVSCAKKGKKMMLVVGCPEEEVGKLVAQLPDDIDGFGVYIQASKIGDSET